MEQAPSECIICGSRERSDLISVGQWSIRRCRECGLGMLDPRPTKEELTQLYESSYFDSHYGEGIIKGSKEFRRRIAQEDHRIRFFRHLMKKGLVLDMGCGMGYFLFACKQAGYSVRGFDISSHASEYAIKELEVPIITGDIEEIDLQPDSVDVLTMWHFLEHTSEPEVYLNAASGLLKQEGLLVVDVPNYESTDAQKIWSQWTGWSVPFHIYHYTPSSLERLLRKNGFEIVRSKDYHSEYIKEKLKRVPLIKFFARPIAKLYSGTGFAVVAKKILINSTC